MATKIADITVTKQSGTRLTINAKGKYIEDDSYFDIAVQNGSATTPATSITANPSISVSSSGLITSTVGKNQTVTPTVEAGYVSTGTTGTITVTGSNTSQLSTIDTTVYNVSTAEDRIIIRKVVISGITASNIKNGAVITVGDSGKATRITSTTGTFTDASTVSSGQTAATAGDIKFGKSAWVDGEEVKGSIANTSITEGTTTVNGTTATRGTATWGDGFISSGTMSAATFTNEGTSGKTYVDISNTTSAPVLVSGDYLYINKGYTDDLKISLAKLVPDGSDVKGHGEYLISGHSAYDDDGTLVAGTIQTIASTDLNVNGKTVTVPVGYYTGANDATPVSADVAEGSYSPSVTSASVSTAPTYTPATSGSITDITTDVLPSGTDGTDYWTITPSGTKTSGTARSKATATISTAGYIEAGSKTTSSYTSKTITITEKAGTDTYIPKAVIAGSSTNASATTTVAPGAVTVSKQSTPSGVTNAASGNATTTAPSSGVYVAVKATVAANNTGTTSAISGSGIATVSTAGYAPSTLTGSISVSGTATAKTSAADSDMTYVPITTATPTFTGGTVSGTATASSSTGADLSTSTDNSGITIATAGSATRAVVKYDSAVSGWVSKSANADAYAQGSATALTGATYYLNGVTISAPSSGTRTFSVIAPDKNGTNHTYLFTTDSSGNTSIKVDATLTMQWNETDQSLDFVYT